MKQEPERKAGLYIRVSTPDQRPELQIPDLEHMAAAKQWPVVDRYIDHGVGGAREHRPELDRMMEDVRSGRINAVVCWSVSRFGRSMVNAVMLMDELRKREVVTFFYQQGLDTSTPVGRGVCALLAALAEAELEENRERTILGIQAARERGKQPGRPPHTDIDLDRVLRLRADGLSWPKIQKILGIHHSVIRRHLGWARGTHKRRGLPPVEKQEG